MCYVVRPLDLPGNISRLVPGPRISASVCRIGKHGVWLGKNVNLSVPDMISHAKLSEVNFLIMSNMVLTGSGTFLFFFKSQPDFLRPGLSYQRAGAVF